MAVHHSLMKLVDGHNWVKICTFLLAQLANDGKNTHRPFQASNYVHNSPLSSSTEFAYKMVCFAIILIAHYALLWALSESIFVLTWNMR